MNIKEAIINLRNKRLIENIDPTIRHYISIFFSMNRDSLKSKDGERGPKGEIGPHGKDGAQGNMGLRGETGPKGETGLQGEKGEKGLRGEKGEKGNMGIQGELGIPGKDGSPDTPNQIIGKINKATDKIDAVTTLEKEIELLKLRLRKNLGSAGGGDVVVAGTGITITRNSSGKRIITATSTSTEVFNEVVSGSGTTFTLANTPTAGTVRIVAGRNRLYPTTDYTISGATITTVLPWLAGDLLADYKY